MTQRIRSTKQWCTVVLPTRQMRATHTRREWSMWWTNATMRSTDATSPLSFQQIFMVLTTTTGEFYAPVAYYTSYISFSRKGRQCSLVCLSQFCGFAPHRPFFPLIYSITNSTNQPTNKPINHIILSIEDGHVIPGLIHKCYLAKKNGKLTTRIPIYCSDLIWSTLSWAELSWAELSWAEQFFFIIPELHNKLHARNQFWYVIDLSLISTSQKSIFLIPPIYFLNLRNRSHYLGYWCPTTSVYLL